MDRTAAQKSCAREGLFTSNSWGYRLRPAANCNNVVGATLTPSVLLAQDVSGHSQGSIFVEGRWLAWPAPHADGKDDFAGVFCLGTGGGAYNNQLDRDHVGVVAGIKF